MVWIYGGAFSVGSSAVPDCNGAYFAERGVVLISLNYRLGRVGYFAHPASAAADSGEVRGSYGLMDAVAGWDG